MNRLTIPESELLQHALIGFQARCAEIDAAMRDIRGRLGTAAPDDQAAPRKPAGRRLSPEGRAAIIAGTKRRWAKIRRLKRMK